MSDLLDETQLLIDADAALAQLAQLKAAQTGPT